VSQGLDFLSGASFATSVLFVFVFLASGAFLLLWKIERQKHLRLWLPSYVRGRRAPKGPSRKPEHIIFCWVDHFEPFDLRRSMAENWRVMNAWLDLYPKLAHRHADSNGICPQHTWFYPGEGYEPDFVKTLVQLTRDGYGEVELHLHHGNDDEVSLRERLETCKRLFAQHGLLQVNGSPSEFAFAFIHGDMALCNSRGTPELCGVNDELRILREAGCFADFSLPTYPCVSQTRKINSIYYASSSRDRIKGHDDGVDVRVGGTPQGHVLLVQGPLALNWVRRKWRIVPHVENGEITAANPGTPDRIHLWVEQGIHVRGRKDWILVKVSCHGAQPQDRDALLGEHADRLYSELERCYRDQVGYHLHYVTAREMYNIIKAAEAGKEGDPHLYRNFVVPPYKAQAGAHPRWS